MATKITSIPEAWAAALKTKTACRKCGHKQDGWTSREFTNDNIIRVCKKCGHHNSYRYWGSGSIV